MSWWRVARNAALVVLCGALVLVPPSVFIEGDSSPVSCRPLGLEWREPVSLGGELTNEQIDAIDGYVNRNTLTDRAEAKQVLLAACRDARQDRQTLIIVVGFLITGWLIVRRWPNTNRDARAATDRAAEVDE